jgi:hypothetical protein
MKERKKEKKIEEIHDKAVWISYAGSAIFTAFSIFCRFTSSLNTQATLGLDFTLDREL